MKKNLLLLLTFFLSAFVMSGQNQPDDIVGVWNAIQKGKASRVSITRASDGTYTGQVIWVEEKYDSDGNVRLDEKNPDKSLRNVPMDQVVLFQGLKFDEKKNNWSGTKIYDPTRGIRANVTCTLVENGEVLRLRGSVLGIGETVEWTRSE